MTSLALPGKIPISAMTDELLNVTRKEIIHLIDHRWMVEDPDRDEHAFLCHWIQERHRTKFFQAVEAPTGGKAELPLAQLRELEVERDRAEEILYWLYCDTQLRKQGKTFPDEWEMGNLSDMQAQPDDQPPDEWPITLLGSGAIEDGLHPIDL